MLINSYTIVDRNNRPNISQRVGLRTFFINDGAYVDPYEISSVLLFKESDTLTPKTVIGAENLVSSTPLMAFAASSLTAAPQTITVGDVGSSAFDPSSYTPATNASGIYRIKTGEYVVVLDETLDLSGWDYTNSTMVAASSLSSVGNYVDLWTVKLDAASKYQVITNRFNLHEDTFFAITEPLLITTSNNLINKHVRLGEKVDLKITTETTLQNGTIDQSIQNIFKDSVITGGMVEIKKVNRDTNYDGPFTVKSFAATDGLVDVTKDNTLILSWDTSELNTLAAFVAGTFGSITGTYSVQVKYNLMNELIISPLFYLTVS